MVRSIGSAIVLLTIVLVTLPASAKAYFPPIKGVTATAVPPEPFPVPPVSGVGEPDAPDPVEVPTAQTPEPASVVMGLVGLAAIAGYRFRSKMQQS
jgi:hypothetical protein